MAISSYVGSFSIDPAKTVGQTQAISGLGFQPKAIIFWWGGTTSSTDACGSSNLWQGIGFATDATHRYCVVASSTDAAASSAAKGYIHNDYCLSNSVGRCNIQSMDSDGFTIVYNVQWNTAYRISYLALGGADLTNVAVTADNNPAATGNADYTVGFQPDAVFFVGGYADSGVPQDTVSGAVMCFGAAIDSTHQGVVAVTSRDAQATMDTKGYSYSGECAARPSATAASTGVSVRGSFVQTLATGFRINWLECPNPSYFHFAALAVKGGNWAMGNTTTRTDGTTWDITPGFQTGTLLAFSSCRAESTQDALTNEWSLSIGAATSDTARVAQASRDVNGAADAVCTTAIENAELYANINASDAIQGLMDVSAIGSTTVTLVMDDADPSGVQVFWVAAEGAAPVAPVVIAITDVAAYRVPGPKIIG